MLKIVDSELAEVDLLDIWLYTAEEWSLAQADIYITQLGRAVESLLAHPEIGKDRSDLRAGYRSLLVNHHIVFYRLNDSEIEVIRVLHESVDLESHI